MALFADYGSPTHEQLVTADATTVRTHTQPAGRASAILIAVTTNKVYATLDGTTPSSTNGLPIVSGGLPVFFPLASATVKWISSAAGGSTVDVLWVK